MATEPILLRVAEAARLLAVSRSKAYEMVATGAIPGVIRLDGGSVRVHRPTLEAWLERQARSEA
jgi:excisionase family DNA binding protein